MSTLYYLILVPMVYLAVGVFLVGTVWRVARVLQRPAFKPTLAIFPEAKPSWLYATRDALFMPSVLRHNAGLWLALMLFHVGLVFLFIGHLELIADIRALQIIPHAIFIGKGAIGLIMLLCLLYFLARRMVSPTKDLSVPEDYLLLVLLFLTILFGAQMDWARAWYDYSTMSVSDYRTYLSSLLVFKPKIGGLADAGHSFMLVAHVFFANVLLMVFPFTKLMHAIFTFALNMIRRG